MSDAAAALVERLRNGDARALGRVLSILERDPEPSQAIQQALTPHLGNCLAMGVTGPPGAGKSTLVNGLVRELRARAKTIGVIAVDPSSPLTGGAVLGDRFRMSEHVGDPGVFVRSVASRGHLGGLSIAAVRMIDALDAAGKDVVILETVGAGQSEVEVAEVADLTVVVCTPGAGDDVQALKAGILEIADVLVVNKADHPLADRAVSQLQSTLKLRAGRAACVPVLRTVATEGTGVRALTDALLDAAASLTEPQGRRGRRMRAVLAQSLADRVHRHILTTQNEDCAAICDAVAEGRLSLDDAVRHWTHSLDGMAGCGLIERENF